MQARELKTADRIGRPRIRRRLHRFRQSRVDNRGSAPDARDAGAVRPDQPHARQRALEYAAGRGRALDAHGRRQHGDGELLRTYIQKCPGRAVSLEIIVSGQPRILNYHDPKFWDLYRNTPAWEFARFLALCDKGKPILAPPPDPAVSQAGAPACQRRSEHQVDAGVSGDTVADEELTDEPAAVRARARSRRLEHKEHLP